ncbi:MAG: cytosine methyltransferase [Vampirovibrio sp.]|jgi:DNA (cytosine-5)-methyltransferase 1|nr:cytosine methyltransferase [Vampirovibrio sp.]
MSRTSDIPKVISLFAGCGGSSLGYKLAGCEVLAAVEYDKNAAAVYRENFEGTRLYEADITLLDPESVLADLNLKPGKLDILDGSPHCQGFSMAGKRRMNDPRNRLFEEYVRFLKIMRPRAFVMENVPGLVIGNMRSITTTTYTRRWDTKHQPASTTLAACGVNQRQEKW